MKIVNRLEHNYKPRQTGAQWYFWGEDNILPQRMQDIVNNNGPARIAIAKLAEYIFGQGFTDEATGKAYANRYFKGETINDLVKHLCNQVAFYNGGFAIRIRRNRSGEVAEIEPLDMGKLRKLRHENGKTTHYDYNDLWGRVGYSSGNSIDLPEYNPDYGPEDLAKIIATQKKRYGYYMGEVLFHYVEDIGNADYPIPPWYSGSEIILGNSNTAKAFNAKAKTSFIPSVVIATTKMDNTRSNDGRLSEKEQFIEGLRAKMGSDDPGQFWLMEAANKDSFPQITTLDTADLPEALMKIYESSASAVYQLFGVDPALAGYAQPGQLGNNQQLAIAEGMLNEKAKALRNEMMGTLEPVLRALGINSSLEITDRRMYNTVPDQLLDVLTVNEKRKLAGYDPLPEPAPATPEPAPVTEPIPPPIPIPQPTPIPQPAP